MNDNPHLADDLACFITQHHAIPVPVESARDRKQWYMLDSALQQAEIEAMSKDYPKAYMDYMKNGDMYWIVKLRPFANKAIEWTIIILYDSMYPSSNSIHFRPISPNMKQIIQIIEKSNVYPKTIPHVKVQNSIIEIITDIPGPFISNSDNMHLAANRLNTVKRWIILFEKGLTNQESWNSFIELKDYTEKGVCNGGQD